MNNNKKKHKTKEKTETNKQTHQITNIKGKDKNINWNTYETNKTSKQNITKQNKNKIETENKQIPKPKKKT